MSRKAFKQAAYIHTYNNGQYIDYEHLKFWIENNRDLLTTKGIPDSHVDLLTNNLSLINKVKVIRNQYNTMVSVLAVEDVVELLSLQIKENTDLYSAIHRNMFSPNPDSEINTTTSKLLAAYDSYSDFLSKQDVPEGAMTQEEYDLTLVIRCTSGKGKLKSPTTIKLLVQLITQACVNALGEYTKSKVFNKAKGEFDTKQFAMLTELEFSQYLDFSYVPINRIVEFVSDTLNKPYLFPMILGCIRSKDSVADNLLRCCSQRLHTIYYPVKFNLATTAYSGPHTSSYGNEDVGYPKDCKEEVGLVRLRDVLDAIVYLDSQDVFSYNSDMKVLVRKLDELPVQLFDPSVSIQSANTPEVTQDASRLMLNGDRVTDAEGNVSIESIPMHSVKHKPNTHIFATYDEPLKTDDVLIEMDWVFDDDLISTDGADEYVHKALISNTKHLINKLYLLRVQLLKQLSKNARCVKNSDSVDKVLQLNKALNSALTPPIDSTKHFCGLLEDYVEFINKDKMKSDKE